MLKKRQKLKKIKQKKAILMSEKISVTLMNKGFSWKYGMVKVVYLLKQGLKHHWWNESKCTDKLK